MHIMLNVIMSCADFPSVFFCIIFTFMECASTFQLLLLIVSLFDFF